MDDKQQIGRLESAVAALLDGFNKLKDEKATLQADLAARGQEIEELKQTINTLQEDKSLVHDKVNTIIASLESWEKTQGSQVAGEAEQGTADLAANPVENNSSDGQQQIFS